MIIVPDAIHKKQSDGWVFWWPVLRIDGGLLLLTSCGDFDEGVVAIQQAFQYAAARVVMKGNRFYGATVEPPNLTPPFDEGEA